MSLLELTGVSHRYGPHSDNTDEEKRGGMPPDAFVLHDFNLKLEPGEFVGLAGPSGSGKSTLLNILGLIVRPTSGEHRFAGINIRTSSDSELRKLRRDQIGFVFQHFCLLAGLSALENVIVAALLAGATPVAARKRAVELLTRVGLAERLAYQPARLSGGERQRVGICRALIHAPRLVLADEPTGSLDAVAAGEILALLGEAAVSGVTIVMASHSERALKACARVVSLERVPAVSGSVQT